MVLRQKPLLGQQIDFSHPLAPDVACWLMNEGQGSTIYDLTPNRNNGVLTNMTPATDWVISEKGYALDFDADDDAINCGSAYVLDDMGPVSFALWIYPRTTGTSRVFGKGGTNAYFGNDCIFLYVTYGSNDLYARTATSWDFPENEWSHLVVTWDGGPAWATGIHFYVNGVEHAAAVGQNGTGGRTTDAGSDLLLGNYAPLTKAVDGMIAAFDIYGKVLGLESIRQLYLEPWCFIK